MAQQQGELNMKKVWPIIILVLGVIILIAFGSRMFYKLKATERGVVFRQFGSGLDKENIVQPGFRIIAPWNDMYRFDVSEQKAEETLSVLDKNGLEIGIDVTVRFHPKYAEVGYLYETFKMEFIQRAVIPEVRSVVRNVAGKYTSEEIFSTKRSQVENEIKDNCNKSLNQNYITMKTLLIRDINLPPKIKNAIELKLQQEQEALAYKFRLDKEKAEADRKRIEAKGIADYNDIISRSLTENILKQKGIDATLELANSKNAKVVVVGSGDDGLPLILGK